MPSRPHKNKIHTYHERAVGLGGVNDVPPNFQQRCCWTRDRSRMELLVTVTTMLFWASGSIMLVLVALSWVASGLRGAWACNLSSGAAVGLGMVTSGLLFWLELRDTRR